MKTRKVGAISVAILAAAGVGAVAFMPSADSPTPKVVTPLVETVDATTTTEPSTDTVPVAGLPGPDPNAVPYIPEDHPQAPPEPEVQVQPAPPVEEVPPAEDIPQVESPPEEPTTTTICVDKPGTPGQPPEKYCY